FGFEHFGGVAANVADVGDQVPDLVRRCRYMNCRRALHGLIKACSRPAGARKCRCSTSPALRAARIFGTRAKSRGRKMVASRWPELRCRVGLPAIRCRDRAVGANLVQTMDPR